MAFELIDIDHSSVQYMRHGGRAERALPLAANAQDGPMGADRVRQIPAQDVVHQTTTLQC